MKTSSEGQFTGSAHIHKNLIHNNDSLLRRILVSYMACRIFGTCREILSPGNIVDLYNSAVQIEFKIFSHITDLIDDFNYFIGIFT